MEKKCVIRKAAEEDAIGLQNCMASAYATYQARMGGVRLPPMDLDYRAEINGFPTWVAECDSDIVGGLTMLFETDHASIANIAVHPDFQGQGLGGGLMRFAKTQAKDKGYSEIRLAMVVDVFV